MSFISIILLLFFVVVCNPQQTSTPAQAPPSHSYPKQERCPSIPAKKISSAGSSQGNWVLVKVTPLADPPPSQYDMNRNFCHPFSYIPGRCQGIALQIDDYKRDKSLGLYTLGHNNVTKSTIKFGFMAELRDTNYAVYQEEYDLYPHLMEEFFDDGRYDYSYPPPKFIFDIQGEEFVKVAKGGNNRWMIFQNCVTKYAWVVLRSDVTIRELWKYQHEYTAALRDMRIDVDKMVDVPIKDNKWEHFDD